MTSTATPADAVSKALDEQLDRRILDALTVTARLLGAPVSDSDGSGPSRLRQAVSSLVDRLADAEDDHGRARETQAAHEQRLDRVRVRSEDRFAALQQAHEAVSRLRRITSPSVMLASAAAELCASSEFDRVVVSLIHNGRMVPEAVHFRDDSAAARAALEALRAHPVRLEHPLIETEVLRRPRATVVTDAQVHPRVDRTMSGIMGWQSYVAAAVRVRSSVVAVIHADRADADRLDVLHRDVLWEFATGLAQAYESASLRRTLGQERLQIRKFLEWLNSRSAELNDAAIELVARQQSDLPSPLLPDVPRLALGGDDRAAFADLLTRRELDVLRLLAEGKTNRAIAAELVLAPGTVKFHVNSILRRLRVANRAQAVSRYFAVLDAGPK